MKSPPGIWFKRYGKLSPEAKMRAALTKRSKKVKVTLPETTAGAVNQAAKPPQQKE